MKVDWKSWSAESDRRGLPWSKPKAALPKAPTAKTILGKAPEIHDELKAEILESFHAKSYEQGTEEWPAR